MFNGPIGPGRTDFARVPHCKIDVGLGTSGGIAVDGANVYIASNRPNLQSFALGGIYRYDSAAWPKGETDADGCSRRDQTGKRLAAADRVARSMFIAQGPLAVTPSDILASGRGTFYVSSVSGTVAEFDSTGAFVRMVLVSAGQLGQPGVIGQLDGITPFGLGLTRDGALWIADIGVVGDGPAAAAGSVVRLPIDSRGRPGTPEIIDDKLEFPDGIGVVTPRAKPSRPAPAAPGCTSRRTVRYHLPRGATRVVLRVDGKRERKNLKGRTLSPCP